MLFPQSSSKPILSLLVLFTVLTSALVWACAGAEDNGRALDTNEPTRDGGQLSSSQTPRDAQADTAKPPVGSGLTSTEANLKVAFIGDTAHGDNFKNVLALIKRENADLVMIQGDVTYGWFTSPSDWFSVIDDSINAKHSGGDATVTIPYFLSKGNHDTDWDKLGSGMKERMSEWGVASEHGDPTTINYSVVYKGLKIVMVDEEETESPSRTDYVDQRFQSDDHVWRVCSWHRNMRATNVGPKDDEMPWSIYEKCREHGAIVAQGHSHTYSRSKTVTNDQAQTVDSSCGDPLAVCVGPGKHFFFDSSLGGKDSRELESAVTGKPYWASKYTGGYGALFIEFNVDGDPNKARGYFKTVGNVVVDPPASSGQTSFTIQRSF